MWNLVQKLRRKQQLWANFEGCPKAKKVIVFFCYLFTFHLDNGSELVERFVTWRALRIRVKDKEVKGQGHSVMQLISSTCVIVRK